MLLLQFLNKLPTTVLALMILFAVVDFTVLDDTLRHTVRRNWSLNFHVSLWIAARL